MGGKKKPTLSQLEKRMRVLSKRERKRQTRVKEVRKESSLPTLTVPIDAIAKDVKKMRCITPYLIATKYGIKISLAKKVLRELSERNVIKLVDRNRRVDIYVPVAA